MRRFKEPIGMFNAVGLHCKILSLLPKKQVLAEMVVLKFSVRFQISTDTQKHGFKQRGHRVDYHSNSI